MQLHECGYIKILKLLKKSSIEEQVPKFCDNAQFS